MGAKKRKKTKKLSSRNTDERKETPVNLFEIRVNRKKHDILGQRLKSDRGLPGISRSKAIQKVCFVSFSTETRISYHNLGVLQSPPPATCTRYSVACQ